MTRWLLALGLLVISRQGVWAGAGSNAALDRAHKALQEKRTVEAKNEAQEALRRNPQLADAEVILGMAWTIDRDLAQAEQHFLRAVSLSPNDPKALGYLGSTYMARQRWKEAAHTFGRVLELQPDHLSAHYNLGVIAVSRKQHEIALRHFQTVVKLKPSDVGALGALLQTQLLAGHKDSARQTAARLEAGLSGGDPRLREAGGMLASAGDYPSAIRMLQKARAADPSSAEIAHDLALAYFRSGDASAAVELLSAFKTVPSALNLLGTIYESTGDLALATQALAKAATTEATNENYRIDYAAILMRGGDNASALREFRTVAKDFPSSARARMGVGCAAYPAGEHNEAAKAFFEAVGIKKDNPLAYRLLRMAVEAAPEYEPRAIESFRAYLSTSPPDAQAHASFAALLIRSADQREGAKDQARKHLMNALALEPDLAEAHVYLGVLALEAGDVQAAIASLRRAVELAPRLPEGHYRLSRAYARAGRIEEAKQQMSLFQEAKDSARAAEKEVFGQVFRSAQ